MIQTLSGPTRKAIALFILLVLVTLAGLAILGPYWATVQLRQERISVEDAIERLEQRLVARENMLAEQRMLERAIENDNLAIYAKTESLAGAEFQGWVSEFIEVSEGKLQRAQILDPKTEGKFAEVQVQAVFTATIGAVREIFHLIETHDPTLILRSVEIRAPANDATLDVAQKLSVTITVAGFVRLEPDQEVEN